jgi:HemY protein
MRTLLSAILLAALVTALAWSVAGLTGRFDASFIGYTLSTTTPVALTALALLVLLLVTLLRLFSWLLSTPSRIAAWRARRRRVAGEASQTRTLVALAAGDAKAASRESARARHLLGDTAQTVLHAAEAARLAGRDDEATALYQMLVAREDGRFLGLRGLFRQAFAREDWSGAQLLANQAEATRPGGLWLREERTQLAARLGNWTQALALAGPETPRNALVVAAAQTETDTDRALRLAKRAFKDNPAFPPAAIAYAERLRAAGRGRNALEVLREAWSHAPHPDLATCYLAAQTDSLLRVHEATALVQARVKDAESQFLMATVTFEAGLMLDARKHADAARSLGMDQPRLWKILKAIARAQPETAQSRQAIQEAMAAAGLAAPDPGWACEACHASLAHWQPACPSCHEAGRILWGAAPRAPRIASADTMSR